MLSRVAIIAGPLAALLCSLAIVACGHETIVDCSSVARWRGGEYLAVGSQREPGRGAVLQPQAMTNRAGCTDWTRVTAQQMQGIDPAVAIWLQSNPYDVYYRRGYFVALPDHPLHRVAFGSPDRPYLAGGRRTCRSSGSITEVGLRQFGVRRPSGRLDVVSIDAGTHIEGFLRAGLPFLQPGDDVRVTGRRCSPESANHHHLTAVTVRPQRR